MLKRVPAAQGTLSAFDDLFREQTGESLSPLYLNGPAEKLDRTINAQPAILAISIAFLHAAYQDVVGHSDELVPAFYAGHSMGQYSAMVAADALSARDALRLVRERGRLMQASAEDGSMAAIIGLADDRLGELDAYCQALGVFTIANRNSPGQVVVSGERHVVTAGVEKAKELGAKRAIVLPVTVAAHSPLMARAADGMREILADIDFGDPRAPLLANADARLLVTGQDCRAELVEHLTRGVDWVGAVERMTSDGVTRFVEIGPGRVLTGLVKRTAPNAEAFALDDQSAANGIAVPDFLHSAASTSGAPA